MTSTGQARDATEGDRRQERGEGRGEGSAEVRPGVHGKNTVDVLCQDCESTFS